VWIIAAENFDNLDKNRPHITLSDIAATGTNEKNFSVPSDHFI